MSETAKKNYPASGDNILQGVYNHEDKSLTTSSFVVGAVGRKILITAFSSTIDDITFSESGTTLYILRVTYDNSSHDNVVSVERTA